MTAAPRPVPWGTEFANPFESPPTAPPAPVVEVRGCAECPAVGDVGWFGNSRPMMRCRLAGPLPLMVGHVPTGCPLRSGPVTLRLVDRGRP